MSSGRPSFLNMKGSAVVVNDCGKLCAMFKTPTMTSFL